jgi:hypothetical protein
MSFKHMRKTTGILFILGAILVNIPYTLLIMNFDYPDILRKPAGEILERFAAGGSSLIWTWLSFAWLGLLLLFAILLLPKVLNDESPIGLLALFFGAVGAFVQMVGLLRWPFVVPILARLYTNPQASAATQEAAVTIFQAIHQYGGVVFGEHIGQLFSILWMVLLSLNLLKNELFPRWFPLAGFAASIVYALAQGELLATAIPGFPFWNAAGLVGSLMWLAWMLALGILLLRMRKETYE